jgi:beta-1,4-mannosyl-glycoprotein beta-1,4-N-acetylglucosaminyltransferase
LHLVVPDSCYDVPLTNEQVSWHREGIQREFPMKTLRFEPNDVIISADVDEIINGNRIPELVDIVSSYGFARIGMRGFFYYINGFQVPEWSYAFAETYERYKQYESLTLTRWNINGITLKDAGSHFSYLGGNEKIKEKLKATAHVEYSGDDFLGTVDNKLESLNDLFDKKFNQQPITIIEIDELYPRTIRENISEWKEYIKK